MRLLDWIKTFFQPYTIRDAYEEGREAGRKRKRERLWDTPSPPITPTPDTDVEEQPQQPITASDEISDTYTFKS